MMLTTLIVILSRIFMKVKKDKYGKEFIVEYRIRNVFGGMITKQALFYCNEDELIFIRDLY